MAKPIPANILASLDMGQVSLAIDALRRLNLSKTLAEPNLVTMNGQPAEFQAGGRFPVPIISAGGNGQNLQGVTFIPFGVSLEFTPTIRDRDIITLQLNAEVSTRDESIGSVIGSGGGGGGGGGGQISGLNSRNFSTAVQLRSGQTIAVAGLLQTNYGASTDRVPFWGDLPIIGATGGINRSSSGEQELVILVTPHLVAPADPTNGFALPGDDVSEPTDIEFYVANRLESRRSQVVPILSQDRSLPSESWRAVQQRTTDDRGCWSLPPNDTDKKQTATSTALHNAENGGTARNPRNCRSATAEIAIQDTVENSPSFHTL